MVPSVSSRNSDVWSPAWALHQTRGWGNIIMRQYHENGKRYVASKSAKFQNNSDLQQFKVNRKSICNFLLVT